MRHWGGIFDIDEKLNFISEEEEKSHAPGFWDNPKEAEKILKGVKSKKIWTDAFAQLDNQLQDLDVLWELEAGDDEVEKQ